MTPQCQQTILLIDKPIYRVSTKGTYIINTVGASYEVVCNAFCIDNYAFNMYNQ